MPLVSSGVEHGNLRELALARMKDLGTKVTVGYFRILCLTINNSTMLISLPKYMMRKLKAMRRRVSEATVFFQAP